MAQPPPPPPSQPDSGLAALGDQLLQQFQAAGGAAGSQFIGLPTNATVSAKQLQAQVLAINPQTNQPYSSTDVAPRYKSGAQWLPVLGGASAQEIATLQLQLAQAGLLTTFQKGNWDAPSQQAFEQLLASANNSGTDWQTQLNTEMNSTTMTIDPLTGLPVAKRKGVAALKLSYTNPDDIATTAQNVAQQYIGRPLSQQELQRFQNVWQSQEKGYQTADYSASAVGGAVTKQASMDTEAQKFAQNVDPTAFQAQQALGLVKHLDGLLRGSVDESVVSKQQLGSEVS